MEIMQIMQSLHAQGRTIVMITHDARNAAYAERTVQLKEGKVDEGQSAIPASISASTGGFS
jgi:ABC-type lipoprotein export system ATPase subunit